jgi:hypothetical protein
LLLLFILSIVMKPATNEIAIITNGIVKVGEPDMKSLATKAQQAEAEASQPCKSVHC